jgi:hypothetical protein
VPRREKSPWPADAFSRAELERPRVPLPASVGLDGLWPVALDHTARYAAMAPLDDYALVESGPARHTLHAALQRDNFADGEGRLSRRHARAWARLADLPGVEPLARDGDLLLSVAQLDVVEFGAHWVDADGGWLDAFDAQGARLGPVLADLAQEPPGHVIMPPCTVYWLKQLDVAPAFRGHRLGASLIAHALWALVYDDTRVAVCEAFPQELQDAEWAAHERGGGTADDWDARPPMRTREECRRLARYYERVGLRRWTRRSRLASDGIPLWHWGGWRLPFDAPAPNSTE